MTTKSSRRSNKNKEMSYEDLVTKLDGKNPWELSPAELEQYGLGSWLKENRGSIASVGGGVLSAVGGILTATGVGAPVGAAFMGAGSVLGQVGNTWTNMDNQAAQDKVIEEQNKQNEKMAALGGLGSNVSYGVVAKYGGSIRKYASGGPTINYTGQSHEGPNQGVEVGPNGNPNPNNPPESIALVEGEEVNFGDYIFSKTLKVNNKRSFADEAKAIQKRYNLYSTTEGGIFKIKKGDPSEAGYIKEMEELTKKQEALRNAIMPKEALQRSKPQVAQAPIMRNGGDLPMFYVGGPTDSSFNPVDSGMSVLLDNAQFLANDSPSQVGRDLDFYNQISSGRLKNIPSVRGSSNMNIPSVYDINRSITNQYDLKSIPTISPILNVNNVVNNSSKTFPFAYDKSNSQFLKRSISPIQANLPVKTVVETAPSALDIQQDLRSKGLLKDNRELYRGMNWGETALAALPGVVGSVTGLLMNSKNRMNKFTKMKAYAMSPEQISLENERAVARDQANIARGNFRTGLRAGAGAGAYMANLAAGETSIQRALGQQLGQSYMNEESTNAQMRQQANMYNLQNRMEAEMYNTQMANQLDQMRRARNTAYISQGLNAITGAVNQKIASNQYYDNLNMMNPNYQLMYTPTEEGWKKNFQLRNRNPRKVAINNPAINVS